MTPTTDADEERDVDIADWLRGLDASWFADLPATTEAKLKEAAAEITRLRSTSQAGGVPEGWKLVPPHPAKEMWKGFFSCNATQDAPPMNEFHRWHGDFGNFAASYAAMLSAAPAPPPTVDGMREALDLCLVGGNHIASVLIGRLGGGFAGALSPDASHEFARSRIPDLDTYEIWCCWSAIMRAREMAEHAALASSPTPAATEIREGLVQAAAEPAASDGSVIVPVCQWQPIETAPKDGLEVMLFYPHYTNDGFVTAGYYYRNEGGDGPYWYADLVNGCASPPTHWMPLPPRPGDRTDETGAQSGCLKQNLPERARGTDGGTNG